MLLTQKEPPCLETHASAPDNHRREYETENSICDECKKIDFESAAKLDPKDIDPFPEPGKIVAALGTRGNSPPQNGCRLCEILHHFGAANDPTYTRSAELGAYSAKRNLGLPFQDRIYFAVWHSYFVSVPFRGGPWIYQFLFPRTAHDKANAIQSRVLGRLIEIELLRK
jgi:hypothetical protein